MHKISRLFACLIVASVLLLTFAVQTFSQSGRNAGLRSSINNFNRSLTQAEPALGDQKIFTLLSQGVGEPAPLLQGNFQQSGLTLSSFILAEIIARLSGENLALVVGLINQNLSLSQILQLVNIDRDIFILAINIFANTFNNEVATINGNPLVTPDQMNQHLNTIINRTNDTFTTLANNFGTEIFKAVLNRQLSKATGIPESSILSLEESLPSSVTIGQFVIALIATNSININIGNDTITPDQFNRLKNNTDLVNGLVSNGIPLNLFVGRVRLLLGILNNAANNGSFISLAR